MIASGDWQRVLLMSYSEFGRRVKQNASNGTDHGSAAAHFLIGGQVKGGIYGEQPSLKRLDAGDLRYTTDFRSLYSTITQHWWQRPASSQLASYAPIDCIRS